MPEVWFRGPMLFMTKAGKLQEIRIPDASWPSKAWKHPDGDPAGVHYAGMIIVEGKKAIDRVDLRGAKVTISDGKGGECGVAKTMALIPDLKAVTDALKAGPLSPVEDDDSSFGDRCAACVTITGGVLSADETMMTPNKYVTSATYGVPGNATPQQIALLFQWAPGDGSVHIEVVGPDPRRIDLTSTQKAYFYNWDTASPFTEPSPTDFEKPPTPAGIAWNGTPDYDFKWLFALVRPPSKWVTWLNSGDNKGRLPCPWVASDGPEKNAEVAENFGTPWVNPPEKDCIAARWELA
ncbi:hypothetical protein BH09GEM1_BH09GEM1_14250 [soil metagenome]